MSNTEAHGHDHDEFVIHIDRHQYKVPGPTITSAGLRQLPNPPIGNDLDIYEELPGQEDKQIEDGAIVELENGLHFFTVPRTINPGR